MVKTVVSVAAASVATAASIITIGVAAGQKDQQQQDINRVVCRAINHQNSIIVTQLERAEKTLPTLSYYKAHPDELKKALDQVRHQIRDFAPVDC